MIIYYQSHTDSLTALPRNTSPTKFIIPETNGKKPSSTKESIGFNENIQSVHF